MCCRVSRSIFITDAGGMTCRVGHSDTFPTTAALVGTLARFGSGVRFGAVASEPSHFAIAVVADAHAMSTAHRLQGVEHTTAIRPHTALSRARLEHYRHGAVVPGEPCYAETPPIGTDTVHASFSADLLLAASLALVAGVTVALPMPASTMPRATVLAWDFGVASDTCPTLHTDTHTQTYRHKHTQTDRQTDRHTQREREREIVRCDGMRWGGG